MKIGDCPLQTTGRAVEGCLVELDREPFYRIAHHDGLDPFLISVVSASDHWLFISSNGALTAGRRDPRGALFPYETDDRIHDALDRTGSKALLRLARADGEVLWEPFSSRYEGLYDIERFLYKSVTGDKLLFEEINHTLRLAFRHDWLLSDRFGFVRRSRLENRGDAPVRLQVLDGLQNLLPAQVDPAMQTGFSTLVDAYKKGELLPATGLGIYSLSSIPVDRAEPSESLTANTVWSAGLPHARRLLSTRQVDAFRRGRSVVQEEYVRGVRGAYFVQSEVGLSPGGEAEWFLVAEAGQDQAAVAALNRFLAGSQPGSIRAALLADVEEESRRLRDIVARADGLQVSGAPLQTARHFSNTLFNVMRGGIFDQDGRIGREDLREHLRSANRTVAARHDGVVASLPESFSHAEGLARVRAEGDPDLERLYLEYLPLTFSRRHGDPSRPWNRFSIETRNPDGSRKLSYQGNWRDIFQNWEALSFSYPGFLGGMIFKFLNASTADGYNPYRVSRDGFDWEVHDPADPWSNIGYWGDHQIIYLLRFLERAESYHPGFLHSLLRRPVFVYADVPYRIRPYEQLLRNPRESIEMDGALHASLMARAGRVGSDGKLLAHPEGDLARANLAEKLLVPLLAKLANFIPEAGIWMNTQRPEWNDANNALVGSGVSLVTLCHLRRYVVFFAGLLGGDTGAEVELSSGVAGCLEDIHGVLRGSRDRLPVGFDSDSRRRFLDGVGRAGSEYRTRLYREGLSRQRTGIAPRTLVEFLGLVREFLDQSIAANRRDDGLYHAYNLMKVEEDGGISVRRLPEMLEGQVAVLSSGLLDARASLDLLAALRASALYRADQHSYLLYPDRPRSGFMERNIIPDALVAASPLARRMLETGDRRILTRDVDGHVRFHSSFRNADVLAHALAGIPDCLEAERGRFLAIYEAVFDHQSFTGRSGSFFKYEGLGCIYWHMVSKLLLAVQELCVQGRENGLDPGQLDRLMEHYRDIQRGIGAHKSVTEQGAFPTDPYSHTPSMTGAQQPGLTGQVKEDFLARMTEVGIRVENGCLRFDPFLLPDAEFLRAPDVLGGIPLPAGSLGITVGHVPVIIRKADSDRIRVTDGEGRTVEIDGLVLDAASSRELFTRSRKVRSIEVQVVCRPGRAAPAEGG